MVREFNNLEEIQKYYDEKTNAYIFIEDDEYIDLIKINFDLSVQSNIIAYDIKARDINVYNINANDIKARNINADDIDVYNVKTFDINTNDIKAHDIKAHDISTHNIKVHDISVHNINACEINAHDIHAHDIIYYAVCFAYEDIFCNSIRGIRRNSRHFVLDGKLEVKDERTNN